MGAMSFKDQTGPVCPFQGGPFCRLTDRGTPNFPERLFICRVRHAASKHLVRGPLPSLRAGLLPKDYVPAITRNAGPLPSFQLEVPGRRLPTIPMNMLEFQEDMSCLVRGSGHEEALMR